MTNRPKGITTMIKTIAGLATSALLCFAFISGTASLVRADDRPAWTPCEDEGDNGCVWDAVHMGNGIGRSYIATKKGKVIYIPHSAAHQLLIIACEIEC